MSGSLRRFKKSKKNTYFIKKSPEFVSGSLRRFENPQKTHILLKKARSSCPAASGGSKNPQKTHIIQKSPEFVSRSLRRFEKSIKNTNFARGTAGRELGEPSEAGSMHRFFKTLYKNPLGKPS